MPFVTTSDIKNDVLFRGGEPFSSSNWDPDHIVDYINRVYFTLCSGASEFLPEYVEDWWWLRRDGVLTLVPPITDGTVQVTEGSVNIVFSSAPAVSVAGWKFRLPNHPEVFEIATHTALDPNATLDSVWTGDTASAATYTLMKVTYTLSSSVAALISAMFGYRGNKQVIGLSPERMDELYPLSELQPGIPTAFSLEDIQTVRFSHGGNPDGKSMRLEYRYRPKVDALTDDPVTEPLVPLEWRHLLSDMALTYLLLDKNDDRSNAVALSARTGLAGMLKENRRRLAKMGRVVGKIYPRTNGKPTPVGPLRTQSGLIIG